MSLRLLAQEGRWTVVQAAQTQMSKVLSGNVQIRVPLYQRHYQWGRPQWDALFRDVSLLAADRQTNAQETHFLGSIVLSTPPGNGHGLLVVDGQQRLVTTSLLLCAIRDNFDLAVPLRKRLEKCLFIFTAGGALPPPYKRLKVLPTQVDREAYSRIVDGQEPLPGSHITRCYLHFRSLLDDLWENEVDDEEVLQEIGVLQFIAALLDGLTCIRITAGPSDNAHRIFESLNNTGMPLTQSDLLRNYVFMRLDEKTDDFFEYSWHPLERRFSAPEFTQLFWLDLILDGTMVNQGQTYIYQQKYLHSMSKLEIKDYVDALAERASSWEAILQPERESSANIRKRLQRMKEWKTTTAAPTLMYLLEQRRLGQATWQEVERAMHYLESYFVRRVTIGKATMNMNRILMAAPGEMAKDDRKVDVALRSHLSGVSKYWASDEEIRETIEVKPFFRHGRAHQKTLILRWIEESLHDHEDELDAALTVEHVMPRTYTSEWQAELRRPGDISVNQARALHDQLVDTIGNLTLANQSKNSKMSNKSFADKKQILHKLGSGMQLTSEITAKHYWGAADVRARSRLMAERIIENWPGPVEE